MWTSSMFPTEGPRNRSLRLSEIDTPGGKLSLKIPAGVSSGQRLRLKGKGLPEKKGSGDLLVSVRIVLPDKSDPDLGAAMRKMRDENPYDPRKNLI